MTWRKYLLVPRLARSGLGRRPAPGEAWESYWGAVSRTGPDGEVLWDGAGERELAWWAETARARLDPRLPVVDVGCGNGRLARLLAPHFPAVLGVDVSASAVELARRESAAVPGVGFRRLDVTQEGAGEALARELGPANVVVRGVLHVLDPAHRRRAGTELARLLDGEGSLLLLETNWQRPLLSYLEHLGARNARMPPALVSLFEHRLPRPTSFGRRELAETFPAPVWTTVWTQAVPLEPVRGLGPHAAGAIPGFAAVVRPAHVAAPAAAADGTG